MEAIRHRGPIQLLPINVYPVVICAKFHQDSFIFERYETCLLVMIHNIKGSEMSPKVRHKLLSTTNIPSARV